MRVSPRQGNPYVTHFPATTRPISMHICGQTYRMEPNEALSVANQLADAVESLKKTEARLEAQSEKED